MAETARATTAKEQRSRAFWLKHLHQWHWMSAAMCLIGMVLFSITGFTLNHASWIGATPEVITQTAQLPEPLLAELKKKWEAGVDEKAALPPPVAEWLNETLSLRATDRETEWSDDEIYVSLPRPGGDAWLTVNLEDG